MDHPLDPLVGASPNPPGGSSRVFDIAACVVLAASLAFRLGFFDQARFASDEALQYGVAKSVAAFDLFPVQGTAITGAVNAYIPGGAYYGILALPLLVFNGPEASMALIVMLSVGGLAIGYRLLRREFGPSAALGGLLLAAFNPFNLFHSDRIWNPNLLLPIGFVFLYLLARTIRGEGRRPSFWLGALLVAAPQIHLSCAHIILLTAVALVVAWPAGFRWRQFAVGMAVGAATYLPYLVADGLRGFENTLALFGNLSGTTAPPIEALRAVYYMVLYAAGDMTYYVAKGAAFPMTEWGFLRKGGLDLMAGFLGLPAWHGVLLIAGIAVGLLASLGATLGMLGCAVVAFARRGRVAVRQNPLMFLAVLNLPLLAILFWGRKAFYPHYTIVVFPLALVPVAWALSRIRSAWLLRCALVVLALVAVAQGVLSARYYRQEEARTSVPVFREAAAAILSDSPGTAVAFGCDLPRTQCSSYPAHVMAHRDLGRDFPEDRAARRRYTLVLPGEEHAVGAVRVWDLGPVWLVRRDRP